MNKKLFLLLILGLLLIPVVISFSPEDFIDFLGKGAERNSPAEIIAYLRILFIFAIGIFTYFIAKAVNISDNVSLAIAAFFALLGGYLAPTKLLLTATMEYTVVIWAILLALPVLAVGALFIFIPGTNKLLRIIRIGLSFLLLGTIFLAKKGFEELIIGTTRVDKIPVIENFIWWAIVIIGIAIIVQISLLIKDWGKLGEAASTGGTTTSTTPAATQTGPTPTMPQPSAQTPQVQSAEKKEYKKKLKKFKKAAKKQRKFLEGLLVELSEKLRETNRKLQQLQQQPQTPETQQDIRDGSLVLSQERQQAAGTLKELSNNLSQEAQAIQQEIGRIVHELTWFNRMSVNKSLSERDKEKLNELIRIKTTLLQRKRQELSTLQGLIAQAAQQGKSAEETGNFNPRLLAASIGAYEDEEETSEQVADAEESQEQELGGEAEQQPPQQPPADESTQNKIDQLTKVLEDFTRRFEDAGNK